MLGARPIITHLELLASTIQRQVLKFTLPAAESRGAHAAILRRLPAYGYADGPSTTRVTSLYLDSDDLALYRQSTRDPERAALIRLRWYSAPLGSPVFLELKHRDAATGLGVKQRYGLPEATSAGFRGSEAELEAVAAHVRRQAGPDIQAFLDQCRTPLRAAALRPRLYVRYRRQSFQSGPDAPERITLDSHVIMAGASDWSPSAGPAYRFPRAILEIKLEAGEPSWLPDLLAELPLTPLGGFSKWTHGVRQLLAED